MKAMMIIRNEMARFGLNYLAANRLSSSQTLVSSHVLIDDRVKVILYIGCHQIPFQLNDDLTFHLHRHIPYLFYLVMQLVDLFLLLLSLN